MTKQQLAQKRNWFKFVVTGLDKPIDLTALNPHERACWAKILDMKRAILVNFDDVSKEKGLNVPNKNRFE